MTFSRYLTTSDVHAIPREQWEAWIVAGVIPWERFSKTVEVREAAFAIARAHIHRLKAEGRATS